MRTRLLIPFLALVALGACRDATDPAPTPLEIGPEFAPLTQTFDSAFAASGVTGASFLVARADSVIYYRDAGNRNTETLLALGAASEWLLGASVMALVEREQLVLDDTIGTWFPGLAGGKGAITVRQLLAHTAGISAAPNECLDDRLVTLQQCAQDILAAPLVSTPGTAFAYSPNGLQVLARIIELVNRAPLPSSVQTLVAAPLGLVLTGWEDIGNPPAAYGALSSTVEFTIFLVSQLLAGNGQGNLLLSQASVLEMERNQTAGLTVPPPAPSFAPAAGHGLGLYVEQAGSGGEGRIVGVPARNGTFAWIDRTRGIAAVLSVPGDSTQTVPFAAAVRSELERILDAP